MRRIEGVKFPKSRRRQMFRRNAFAAHLGRRVTGRPISPHNPRKTWAGAAAGTLATLAVAALPLVASTTATDEGCCGGCCCPDGPCCEAR